MHNWSSAVSFSILSDRKVHVGRKAVGERRPVRARRADPGSATSCRWANLASSQPTPPSSRRRKSLPRTIHDRSEKPNGDRLSAM